MRWAAAVTPQRVAAETFGDGMNTAKWRAGFLEDIIILSLRKASGLDLAIIAAEVGTAEAAAVAEACQELEPSGLVALQRPGGSPWPVVRLTAPSGFLMENTVIKRLLRDFE